jgi:hypothetical protein
MSAPRLSYHLNDLVKRDLVCSVACESQGGRVDSLDRAKSVTLNTWDLDETANWITGHAELMLHGDLGRVLYLRRAWGAYANLLRLFGNAA